MLSPLTTEAPWNDAYPADAAWFTECDHIYSLLGIAPGFHQFRRGPRVASPGHESRQLATEKRLALAR